MLLKTGHNQSEIAVGIGHLSTLLGLFCLVRGGRDDWIEFVILAFGFEKLVEKGKKGAVHLLAGSSYYPQCLLIW